MNQNKQVIERAMARDYWLIKQMGTVEEICERYSVNRPRLIRIANRYKKEFENEKGAPAETDTPSSPPSPDRESTPKGTQEDTRTTLEQRSSPGNAPATPSGSASPKEG